MKDLKYKVKSVGVPYKGSKRKLMTHLNKVLENHLDLFGNDIVIYDLFGGGGSVSFSLAQHPRVKKVVYNELDKDLFDFIMFLKNTSQEEFYERFVKPFFRRDYEFKDKNERIFFERCYTFGNGGTGYIYGKHNEKMKEYYHLIIRDNDKKIIDKFQDEIKVIPEMYDILEMSVPKNMEEFQLKRIKLQGIVEPYIPTKRCMLQHATNINLLYNVISFIKNGKIEFHNKSYLDFKDFEENAFIYLDPPYQNTSGYNVDFDFEKFKEFISNYKCYVSEYNLEHKDYEVIFEKLKRNIGGVATEKIYAHKYFIEKTNDKSKETNGLF